MDNLDLRLKVHQPEQSIGQPSQINNEQPQFSMISDFHYNGNGKLWVISREGVCYCLDGSQGKRRYDDKPGLTVYCSHRIANFVDVDMHRELQSVECFGQKLYHETKTRRVDLMGRTVYYNNFVSDYDISAKGGSLYIQSLDIVICTVDPVLSGIRHPFSPAVELTSELIGQRQTAGAGSIKIRIIDNEGVTATKWYCVGEIPISVHPVQHPDLGSGVYVIYRGATEVDEVRRRYTLADLESGKLPISFYNSKAEALAADRVAATKLETEQTKLETEQLKAKQQKQKPVDEEIEALRAQVLAANERERKLQQQQQDDSLRIAQSLRDQHQRDIEAERKRWAAETEVWRTELEILRKEREARTKDRYDDLSYERKNFNEMLKMIPAIVSIVLSVVVLVKAKK